MSEAQKRVFLIADNQTALNAGWDLDKLAEQLSAIVEIDCEIDIEITGLSGAEIDLIIESPRPEEQNAPENDQLPDNAASLKEVQPGDIWQLGDHRLICGNVLDNETLPDLMGCDIADMVFTDPPYNTKIVGNVGGLNTVSAIRPNP